MKKLVCLAIALVMVLGLAACASAEFKFERKIDLVCPWGVGGGADSTLRPLATLLQDILGVPVEVVNVEGGSGVNGVEYTYKQPAERLHLHARHPVPVHSGHAGQHLDGL